MPDNRLTTLNAVHLSDTTKGWAEALNDNFAELDERKTDIGDTSTLVHDGSYVHTDNNFTDAYKAKLDNAEQNVQSDWNQSDSTADDYIKNKPENLVQDASYVHTDNNYTSAEKNKLAGVAAGAEVNVQSDWNESDNTSDAYIANKPTLGTAAAKDFTTSVTQNSGDLVTSGAVFSAIDNLPEPMVFKGTLGTGGTITTLPTAAASNEGYTYKVITAGTYASQTAKVGDVFVSNGSAWVLIPAGDDIEDTWRAINVNGTQLKGNGITSGAINFKNGGNVTVTGSGSDITLGVASGYSIPSTTQQTAWTNKQDALDAQTAYTAKGTSTKVPTITTNALGQVTAITETDIAFPTVDISGKMDKANPEGTGKFILNRKSGSSVSYGDYSFTAGYSNVAKGNESVAFGYGNTASGVGSFVEGIGNTASGASSHAEGNMTTASAGSCHAEGFDTIASKLAQHVFGEYNIEDTESNPLSRRIDNRTEYGRYVEIVGNGTADNARSNARTLDWNGNETLAGNIKLGNHTTIANNSSSDITVNLPSSAGTIATQEYVQSQIGSIDQKVVLSFDATGWTAGDDGYYTKTIATTKYPINCFNNNNKVVMATLGVTKSGTAVTAITIESDEPFAGYVVAL